MNILYSRDEIKIKLRKWFSLANKEAISYLKQEKLLRCLCDLFNKNVDKPNEQSCYKWIAHIGEIELYVYSDRPAQSSSSCARHESLLGWGTTPFLIAFTWALINKLCEFKYLEKTSEVTDAIEEELWVATNAFAIQCGAIKCVYDEAELKKFVKKLLDDLVALAKNNPKSVFDICIPGGTDKHQLYLVFTWNILTESYLIRIDNVGEYAETAHVPPIQVGNDYAFRPFDLAQMRLDSLSGLIPYLVGYFKAPFPNLCDNPYETIYTRCYGKWNFENNYPAIMRQTAQNCVYKNYYIQIAYRNYKYDNKTVCDIFDMVTEFYSPHCQPKIVSGAFDERLSQNRAHLGQVETPAAEIEGLTQCALFSYVDDHPYFKDRKTKVEIDLVLKKIQIAKKRYSLENFFSNKLYLDAFFKSAPSFSLFEAYKEIEDKLICEPDERNYRKKKDACINLAVKHLFDKLLDLPNPKPCEVEKNIINIAWDEKFIDRNMLWWFLSCAIVQDKITSDEKKKIEEQLATEIFSNALFLYFFVYHFWRQDSRDRNQLSKDVMDNLIEKFFSIENNRTLYNKDEQYVLLDVLECSEFYAALLKSLPIKYKESIEQFLLDSICKHENMIWDLLSNKSVFYFLNQDTPKAERMRQALAAAMKRTDGIRYHDSGLTYIMIFEEIPLISHLFPKDLSLFLIEKVAAYLYRGYFQEAYGLWKQNFESKPVPMLSNRVLNIGTAAARLVGDLSMAVQCAEPAFKKCNSDDKGSALYNIAMIKLTIAYNIGTEHKKKFLISALQDFYEALHYYDFERNTTNIIRVVLHMADAYLLTINISLEEEKSTYLVYFNIVQSILKLMKAVKMDNDLKLKINKYKYAFINQLKKYPNLQVSYHLLKVKWHYFITENTDKKTTKCLLHAKKAVEIAQENYTFIYYKQAKSILDVLEKNLFDKQRVEEEKAGAVTAFLWTSPGDICKETHADLSLPEDIKKYIELPYSSDKKSEDVFNQAIKLAKQKNSWDMQSDKFFKDHSMSLFQSGKTLLHIAAAYNNVRLTKYLLDSHAYISMRDDNGYTPFHVAVMYRHSVISLLYLDRFKFCIFNADKGGYTAVHLCAYLGYDDVLGPVLTVAKKPPFSDLLFMRDRYYYNAKKYADICGYNDISDNLARLMKGFENIYSIKSKSAKKDFFILLQKSHTEQQTNNILRRWEAERQILTTNGLRDIKKYFKYAIFYGSTVFLQQLFNFLLDMRVSSDDILGLLYDRNSETLLDYAAMAGFSDIARCVVENFNSLSVSYDSSLIFFGSWSPLHRAAARGHCDVLRIFLEFSSAGIDSISEGWSLLHEAVVCRDPDNRDKLITLINEKDHNKVLCKKKEENGFTPLHLALIMQHYDTVQQLHTLYGDNSGILDNVGITGCYFCEEMKGISYTNLISSNLNAYVKIESALSFTPQIKGISYKDKILFDYNQFFPSETALKGFYFQVATWSGQFKLYLIDFTGKLSMSAILLIEDKHRFLKQPIQKTVFYYQENISMLHILIFSKNKKAFYFSIWKENYIARDLDIHNVSAGAIIERFDKIFLIIGQINGVVVTYDLSKQKLGEPKAIFNYTENLHITDSEKNVIKKFEIKNIYTTRSTDCSHFLIMALHCNYLMVYRTHLEQSQDSLLFVFEYLIAANNDFNFSKTISLSENWNENYLICTEVTSLKIFNLQVRCFVEEIKYNDLIVSKPKPYGGNVISPIEIKLLFITSCFQGLIILNKQNQWFCFLRDAKTKKFNNFYSGNFGKSENVKDIYWNYGLNVVFFVMSEGLKYISLITAAQGAETLLKQLPDNKKSLSENKYKTKKTFMILYKKEGKINISNHLNSGEILSKKVTTKKSTSTRAKYKLFSTYEETRRECLLLLCGRQSNQTISRELALSQLKKRQIYILVFGYNKQVLLEFVRNKKLNEAIEYAMDYYYLLRDMVLIGLPCFRFSDINWNFSRTCYSTIISPTETWLSSDIVDKCKIETVAIEKFFNGRKYLFVNEEVFRSYLKNLLSNRIKRNFFNEVLQEIRASLTDHSEREYVFHLDKLVNRFRKDLIEKSKTKLSKELWFNELSDLLLNIAGKIADILGFPLSAVNLFTQIAHYQSLISKLCNHEVLLGVNSLQEDDPLKTILRADMANILNKKDNSLQVELYFSDLYILARAQYQQGEFVLAIKLLDFIYYLARRSRILDDSKKFFWYLKSNLLFIDILKNALFIKDALSGLVSLESRIESFAERDRDRFMRQYPILMAKFWDLKASLQLYLDGNTEEINSNFSNASKSLTSPEVEHHPMCVATNLINLGYFYFCQGNEAGALFFLHYALDQLTDINFQSFYGLEVLNAIALFYLINFNFAEAFMRYKQVYDFINKSSLNFSQKNFLVLRINANYHLTYLYDLLKKGLDSYSFTDHQHYIDSLDALICNLGAQVQALKNSNLDFLRENNHAMLEEVEKYIHQYNKVSKERVDYYYYKYLYFLHIYKVLYSHVNNYRPHDQLNTIISQCANRILEFIQNLAPDKVNNCKELLFVNESGNNQASFVSKYRMTGIHSAHRYLYFSYSAPTQQLLFSEEITRVSLSRAAPIM